jgi:hypothetical protein
MRKIISFTLLLFLQAGVLWANVDGEGYLTIEYLAEIEQLQVQSSARVQAAEAAMLTVQQAGRYVESLAALLADGSAALPVGIKKGSYELIVQRILYDEETEQTVIHASCAFRAKESGQLVAFEGSAVLEGENGIGTEGVLELIAPVRYSVGSAATLVLREGSQLRFSCNGVEEFAAKMAWMATAESIVAVDINGNPTGKPLAFTFEASFADFDSYVISLNIEQSFAMQRLPDAVFTLKGVTLDQSDTETSGMARFPEGYFSSGSAEEKNLWKGLSFSEATVRLPSFLKKPDDSGRITLLLQQVLFDENGFTASVSAQDIISSGHLQPDQWDISLSSISLGIFKSEVVAFGFEGSMNIPPFGANSLLPYKAIFNSGSENYDFIVSFSGKFELPVIHASLEIMEGSYVRAHFVQGEFYPTVNAVGKLSIDLPVGEKGGNTTFSIPNISFEGLKLSRAFPFFEVGALSLGGITSPNIAGFQLSFKDIGTFSPSIELPSIDLPSVDLPSVNLPTINGGGAFGGFNFDGDISLSEMFVGSIKIRLFADFQKWKFEKVEIDKVHVDYKSKAFSITGKVEFKNGDAVYGDGFRGDVKLLVIDKFDLNAVAVFGKKDDFRYFLTDAFLEMTPPAGITVPPALLFYGFGGGLYTKMQQTSKVQNLSNDTDMDFGKSLSGITYVPSRNVGLGLMATTKFALTGSPNAFNAKVGLELQFNSYGGLNFVQLRGEASLMNAPDAFGKLSDNITDGLKKMEAAGITQPTKASKNDLSVPENKSSGFLTASLNIEYDVVNNIFSGDLNAYLNAGVVKGVGANDRLGWASLRFAPDKWYLYAGTPASRLGVKVLNLAELNGYFMLGDDIPSLPPPPNNVLNNLSADMRAKLQRGSVEKLSLGKGIAFGMGMQLGFDAQLPPFYAKIGAGLGTEFLLVDLRGKTCEGSTGTPGINGWYASAQAWAFVEADIGVKVRVFGTNHNFSILDIGASTLLQGAGPNPMYFAGAVGGHFSVMGGLVSGSCTFDFEVGDKCKIVGGSPFGEDVIADLTPATGSSEVNVFAAPQALFNIPVEVEMTIDEEGGAKGTYKATLEEFSVKYADGGAVAGKPTMDSENKIYALKPTDPFESQKDAELYVKVGFKKKQGSAWVAVKGDNGAPVYEEKRATFHTGDRPKEILPEHVKYSYPVSRQYNFYPDEHREGYLHVTENYAYLFTTEKPEGFKQVVRIGELGGSATEKDFTFTANAAGSDIRIEISFSLEGVNFAKNKLYTLEIVNLPEAAAAGIASNVTTTSVKMEAGGDVSVSKQQATGTLVQLSEKQIYALNFRTSSYGTFKEKMEALPNGAAVAWQEYPSVYRLIANTYDYASPAELFAADEIDPAADPLVVVEPLYDKTAWFTDKVKPLIYSANMLSAAGMSGKQPPMGGIVRYVTQSAPAALTDDNISANLRPNVSPWGSLQYNAPYYVDRDFVALRNAVANRSLTGLTAEQHAAVEKLLNADHIPLIAVGNYPVKINYVLPGTAHTVTSSIEKVVTLTKF